MLILLSPAKTLDPSPRNIENTQPRLLDAARELAGRLREKSPAELSDLMSISDKLASLNHERYQQFSTPFTSDNATPALLTFKGDVYLGLEAAEFTEREFEFANRQIRVLSGLYGLLRPRDLMQAYRLEMGTKLENQYGSNLYEYWGDRITELINEDLARDPSGLLLNLASQEYFKSVNAERIQGRVLNVHFKELRKGKYKVITLNAKKARGKMARLITLEGITEAEPLKALKVNGYAYSEKHSSENDWVFTTN